MTTSIPSISAPAHTWSVVDDGVWVATVDGEFAGMAERTAATDFHLTDHVARDLGRFRSLAAAQRALGRTSGPGAQRRPARRRFEIPSLLGGRRR